MQVLHSKKKMCAVHSAPPGKRKEIYRYEAPWTVYSMNWSIRPDKRFRLALGSFVEEYNNKVASIFFIKIKLNFFYLTDFIILKSFEVVFTEALVYFFCVRGWGFSYFCCGQIYFLNSSSSC